MHMSIWEHALAAVRVCVMKRSKTMETILPLFDEEGTGEIQMEF